MTEYERERERGKIPERTTRRRDIQSGKSTDALCGRPIADLEDVLIHERKKSKKGIQQRLPSFCWKMNA